MIPNNIRVLLTGSTGLVGSTILERLANGPWDVVATAKSRTPHLTAPNITFIPADLRDATACGEVVKGVDLVIHMAANTSGAASMAGDPLQHVTPNLVMNSALLEAAYKAGVKKVVWPSSTTGYPDSDEPVTEDMMMTGDPYGTYFCVGWMKRYTEVLCRTFSEKLPRKMPCVVVRPTNVFGPRDKFDPQKSHMLAALLRKVVDGANPIEVWGDGTDVRDLVYVDDMVDAIFLAAEKIDGYDPVNIGGHVATVKEILQFIQEEAGRTDVPVQFDLSKPRMIPRRYVDKSKAKRLLGFEAKVSLRDGIAKTIEWYRTARKEGRL